MLSLEFLVMKFSFPSESGCRILKKSFFLAIWAVEIIFKVKSDVTFVGFTATPDSRGEIKIVGIRPKNHYDELSGGTASKM